jgi:hypothetical protein
MGVPPADALIKRVLRLAQQFTPDFLTAALPFDSVNNGRYVASVVFLASQ